MSLPFADGFCQVGRQFCQAGSDFFAFCPSKISGIWKPEMWDSLIYWWSYLKNYVNATELAGKLSNSAKGLIKPHKIA
jgi:hypothetical protein